ncbi:MAG: hypothetical protein F4Z28_08045, partial [Gammaproteobacteria bacterium]|nr:hypothetical protein [Gammaproteobacteria bacterium]
MTGDLIDADDQIVDDILPVRPDEPAIPAPLTLQPWHRPRKQFVRERQWAYLVQRLVSYQLGKPGMNSPHDRPEVRYLNLPGVDYLDTRLIGKLCNDLGCQLTATGFLAGNERNPQIARAKVQEEGLIESGLISDYSHTLPRRLEEVADLKSQTYRELERRGAFHIVNIDACGSVAPPTSDHSRRLIDAIYRLLEFQFTSHASRWLLFLTTDARPASVARETIGNLWNAVTLNADSDATFRHMVADIFNLPKADQVRFIPQSVSTAGTGFLQLLSLGFGKWALHLAERRQWRVKAHSTYCYSTTVKGDDTPTMACLAYEFRPPPPTRPDPFGVAAVSASEPIRAPGQTDSMRIAPKVNQMTNRDVT